MFIRFTSIVCVINILSIAVNAKGQIAQVVDANDFCVFLPPSDSTNRIISDTEWNANAFCLGNTPLATNAEKLPAGFIKSAHYLKTDTYVQVTGQMDYTKANLVGTDGGGQMDVRAPMGSSCAGWKFYVNLIEPTTNTYCMRCCNDDRTCNRGISEKGCAHIIPGDYSGPNGSSGDDTIVTTTTTTTTVIATTTTISPIIVTTPTANLTTAVVTPLTTVSASSSVVLTPAAAASSPATPIEIATAQSVSGASYNRPMAIAFCAGLLATAVLA
ncbi:hypothetical protein INT47_008968 [Mucor saturninus]|uniref:Uncharacterized protein n=1 Tax=Mucor saturninus TaxID=64648 RepID=A0A8H7R4B9_9FUNG|nr:hypothetical protein INT47_008968 [Mucor saturninus]